MLFRLLEECDRGTISAYVDLCRHLERKGLDGDFVDFLKEKIRLLQGNSYLECCRIGDVEALGAMYRDYGAKALRAHQFKGFAAAIRGAHLKLLPAILESETGSLLRKDLGLFRQIAVECHGENHIAEYLLEQIKLGLPAEEEEEDVT